MKSHYILNFIHGVTFRQHNRRDVQIKSHHCLFQKSQFKVFKHIYIYVYVILQNSRYVFLIFLKKWLQPQPGTTLSIRNIFIAHFFAFMFREEIVCMHIQIKESYKLFISPHTHARTHTLEINYYSSLFTQNQIL